MKRSIYAVISLIMMVMAVGFTACGDDDNKGFSAEQSKHSTNYRY